MALLKSSCRLSLNAFFGIDVAMFLSLTGPEKVISGSMMNLIVCQQVCYQLIEPTPSEIANF
jgi:hypothetical protein